MSDKIGFIGLGIMGRPMALNLKQADHDLWVFARRTESMNPLVEAGATPCDSPAGVARQADIVFTMVSDTADVEQVIFGDNGIIEGIQPGAVVIDLSTISPSATRSMAERLRSQGAVMLDAPVSGGDAGAIAGTLSIMVGGDPKVFDRVRPLFDVMGKNIVHIGGNGAGQVCKACNQVVVSHTIAGVGEAFLLAQRSGVDGVKVREALLGGSAKSRILEVHGQRMLDENYEPGFKAKLHRKDLRIVTDAAYELGLPLPGTAQIAQYLNALVGADLGELDSAAIFKVQQGLSEPIDDPNN